MVSRLRRGRSGPGCPCEGTGVGKKLGLQVESHGEGLHLRLAGRSGSKRKDSSCCCRVVGFSNNMTLKLKSLRKEVY